jgi:hypothetical protein
MKTFITTPCYNVATLCNRLDNTYGFITEYKGNGREAFSHFRRLMPLLLQVLIRTSTLIALRDNTLRSLMLFNTSMYKDAVLFIFLITSVILNK